MFKSGKAASSLFMEGVVREVDVGIHPHEIGSPQRIKFDIHVILEDAETGADSIDEVLDYEYLIASLDRVLEMKRSALLETISTRILDEVMAPVEVAAATVSATKLDVLEDDGRLGCTMTRVK
jgi:dihydroneopterin aldolase|tara:strand:- start:202 stop:570 length:369 start_codon:yes stop_codon:yes gene_type:complete